jgi:hypothetical protein
MMSRNRYIAPEAAGSVASTEKMIRKAAMVAIGATAATIHRKTVLLKQRSDCANMADGQLLFAVESSHYFRS